MQNELLLAASLFLSFSGLLFFHRAFGKSGIYVWIGVCAILANIEVTILVNAFGMEQTLGNTLFASSFLATDILSELYGKKAANKGVCTGIAVTMLFIIFSFTWVNYLPSEHDMNMNAVRSLFSSTPRILLSSLLGYVISQFIDVFLYHMWWDITAKKTDSREKALWFRNNFSTLISQLINIVSFNFLAFFGVYSLKELLSITLSCYIIYIFTSLLDTPFIYIERKHFIEKQKRMGK